MTIREAERRQRQSAESRRQNEEHRQQQPRKPRRYLRKVDLCVRYGWKAGLSVDRNWKEYGTIPPPTRYVSRFPVWDEEVLDRWDAEHAFDADA